MTQQITGRNAPRNQLDMRKIIALTPIVRERYAASNMSDAKFAEAISNEVGFTVTEANIYGVRRALDIESNITRLARERAEEKARVDAERAMKKAKEPRSETLLQRVDRLEFLLLQAMQRIDALERFEFAQTPATT
jgi:hypothetical protein